MMSLTEAFLVHGAMAYPCGIKVKESKKMLTDLPAFRNVEFASPKAGLRSTLTKGAKAPVKAKVGGRG